VPGAVNRSSLDLSATYHVNAAITVASGSLDVTTTINVRNDSGGPIDRLELNTIAARLGAIKIIGATVDDLPVKVRVTDQTLVVPLGGTLPQGASTTMLLEYTGQLRRDTAGSDWMFTRSGGTLALYRWIPWVSRAVPFDRPNEGDPFVLPTSDRVDVELLTDLPMVLAAPATDITQVAAGAGEYWSFSMEHVRDVSIVLAPDFQVIRAKVHGVPIRVYTRSGTSAGQRLLSLATRAITDEADRLGVAYPWPGLAVVETTGGTGLESPGLVWIPRNLSSLNRTYMVSHEIAHQWFYALVGNDQQAQPFADEGAADLLARTVLGALRPSRCSREPLDRSIRAYSRGCYYEVIYVQGGLVLDQLRQAMGTSRFWAAMATYLNDNRYGLAGTKVLLDTLQKATKTDLSPILKARFPTLY
jgi:aminopeptidase N